jgi:hypothetical protein
MTEIDMNLPPNYSASDLPPIIERVCLAAGLTITHTTTLAQYPGSIHWHLKRGKQPGTLEITWWETKQRLWFKVAAGRTGEWMEELLPVLREGIEAALYGIEERDV